MKKYLKFIIVILLFISGSFVTNTKSVEADTSSRNITQISSTENKSQNYNDEPTMAQVLTDDFNGDKSLQLIRVLSEVVVIVFVVGLMILFFGVLSKYSYYYGSHVIDSIILVLSLPILLIGFIIKFLPLAIFNVIKSMINSHRTRVKIETYKIAKEILELELAFDENMELIGKSPEILAQEFSKKHNKPTESELKSFLKEKADQLRKSEEVKLSLHE